MDARTALVGLCQRVVYMTVLVSGLDDWFYCRCYGIHMRMVGCYIIQSP